MEMGRKGVRKKEEGKWGRKRGRIMGKNWEMEIRNLGSAVHGMICDKTRSLSPDFGMPARIAPSLTHPLDRGN